MHHHGRRSVDLGGDTIELVIVQYNVTQGDRAIIGEVLAKDATASGVKSVLTYIT